MVNIPHWPKIPIWQIPYKIDFTVSLKLLNALGNPQQKVPPTIHIAGTNGKGSTLAMLKSIFMQSGYKVHSYTSPHLLEFNERIKIADIPITDSHLFSILDRVQKAAEKINIEVSFFEGTTAAAFLAFAESKADILLLETGLGGRLDCTNVITDPILTIITSISYDHMEYLGTTLMQIAFEKAGIIKQNTPCVIAPQAEEVYNLLFNKCDEMNAPSFCYEYDFYTVKVPNGFQYLSQKFNIDLPLPSLKGDHQIQNAATATAATMLLNKKFDITTSNIAKGLVTTYWPGRLQLVNIDTTKKLAGHNIKIYLDGAHNVAGALCLSNWIKDNLIGNIYLILGMTRNRDVSAFCKFFQNCINGGAAVSVKSEPSSYSAKILAIKAKQSDLILKESESLTDAIQYLSILNKKAPATIIITGSLFLVSDFLKL